MQHQRESERSKTSVPRHVLRRDHQHPVRRAYEEPARGRRSVGRQRLRWKDVIRKDLEAEGLTEEDAANRNKWRHMTKATDPAIQWDYSTLSNKRRGYDYFF